MNRRRMITMMAGALAMPAVAARADAVSDGIVAQLKDQGFHDITVETTWLGRLRILAMRADGQREIVANPRTGEILRDVWTGSSGKGRTAILDDVGDGTSGSDGKDGSGSDDGGSDGSGSDGSGSGSDDSGSDDSGSSSGGSGSGSGSSGSGHGSGKDDSGDDSGDDSEDDSGKDK